MTPQCEFQDASFTNKMDRRHVRLIWETLDYNSVVFSGYNLAKELNESQTHASVQAMNGAYRSYCYV